MTGTPTWLSQPTIIIAKTANGFAVESQLGADITQTLVFSQWSDLTYYLDNNWANPPAP